MGVGTSLAVIPGLRHAEVHSSRAAASLRRHVVFASVDGARERGRDRRVPPGRAERVTAREWLDAMAGYRSPPQNMLVADRAGTIAIPGTTGRVSHPPRRRPAATGSAMDGRGRPIGRAIGPSRSTPRARRRHRASWRRPTRSRRTPQRPAPVSRRRLGRSVARPAHQHPAPRRSAVTPADGCKASGRPIREARAPTFLRGLLPAQPPRPTPRIRRLRTRPGCSRGGIAATPGRTRARG